MYALISCNIMIGGEPYFQTHQNEVICAETGASQFVYVHMYEIIYIYIHVYIFFFTIFNTRRVITQTVQFSTS